MRATDVERFMINSLDDTIEFIWKIAKLQQFNPTLDSPERPKA